MTEKIEILEIEIASLRHVLGTLISRMSGSANSPISISEAGALCNMLDKKS